MKYWSCGNTIPQSFDMLYCNSWVIVGLSHKEWRRICYQSLCRIEICIVGASMQFERCHRICFDLLNIFPSLSLSPFQYCNPFLEGALEAIVNLRIESVSFQMDGLPGIIASSWYFHRSLWIVELCCTDQGCLLVDFMLRIFMCIASNLWVTCFVLVGTSIDLLQWWSSGKLMRGGLLVCFMLRMLMVCLPQPCGSHALSLYFHRSSWTVEALVKEWCGMLACLFHA